MKSYSDFEKKGISPQGQRKEYNEYLREYAAIMAMNALFSPGINVWEDREVYRKKICEMSVKIADELLLELEKPHNSPKQPTT